MRARSTALAVLLQVLATAPPTALAETIQLLPLSHRDADEIAASLQPHLADDESVSAIGSQLLIRAGKQSFEEIRHLVAELDRPRPALRLKIRLDTRAENNSPGGLEDIRIESGGRDRSARVVIAGGEDTRVRQQSLHTVQVLDGGEAWLSLQHTLDSSGSSAPRLTVSVRARDFPRPGLSTRARAVPAARHSHLRFAGSGLRVVPYLRGDQVVAELAVFEANAERDGHAGAALSYEGQLQAPLGSWVLIATALGDTEFEISTAHYPMTSRRRRASEIWVLFELAPAP
jgi:hypothetical protein